MKQIRPASMRSHSNLFLAFILAAGAVYVSTNSYPAVRFDRERIDVWALPGQVQVTGLYHYRNDSSLPKLLSLGLPFPVDSTHERPSTFTIAEATEFGRDLQSIRPLVHRGNVSFRLLFKPREEKWVRVDYVQRAHTADGRYILKTTRAWRKPLAAGTYVLHLGRGLSLLSSNYALDADGAFHRTDFYPDEDWIIVWMDRGATSEARGVR